MQGAACLGISALKGHGLEAVMPAVLQAFSVWNQRVTTARLNKWLVKVRMRCKNEQYNSVEDCFEGFCHSADSRTVCITGRGQSNYAGEIRDSSDNSATKLCSIRLRDGRLLECINKVPR